jgi:hypothetical protein
MALDHTGSVSYQSTAHHYQHESTNLRWRQAFTQQKIRQHQRHSGNNEIAICCAHSSDTPDVPEGEEEA